ncbi:diacylglycerol O-acyltransferase [Mycobacterium asiaticum]|uniref:Diacylglycerol O-acyltransferase n=1 Tax=Mycobacterium asiaticum TaxID=1790 RepID=A0A1A3NP90_MYCAS|nr:wax ester/triacylglycerol synthase family O-acyltransferase [Mycobacterium asiaticum]OBK23666.1 diacylglycerol O-acyltransferase [Mycobacterium asiaticum]
MQLIAPMDWVMLSAESREHPMHVAGLQLYQPPPGAGPDFIRGVYEAMLAHREAQPTFRKRPAQILGGMPGVTWSFDDEIDLEYHLRRSALPGPGRVRELLELTSRLHSGLLDRHRPLWETHLIEGLQDGRFAVYTKMHHALVDGVSALDLLQRSLSSGPSDDQIRVPWDLPPAVQASQPTNGPLGRAVGTAKSLAGLAPATVALARGALLEQQTALPFRAPRTMLNVPIGGARRCAAQSWSLERVKAVKNAADATVNDIVLAMCAGALRSYLLDRDALPDAPLVAMVPVSLRKPGDPAGGNMVAAVLCNLATHLDDPAKRVEAIKTSMRESKRVLSQLSKTQAMALSATTVLGPAILAGLPGLGGAPPTFNVCVSNVPGMRNPLHLNGARLDGSYPMSIVLDGQALNITLASSADSLDFGLVGCRRSVPHLQRLLGDLETSLKDLERAVGL